MTRKLKLSKYYENDKLAVNSRPYGNCLEKDGAESIARYSFA